MRASTVVLLAFAVCFLAAVATAVEVEDEGLGDTINHDGRLTRTVVRNHERLTREKFQEEHENVMDLLNRVEEQVSGMDPEDKDQIAEDANEDDQDHPDDDDQDHPDDDDQDHPDDDDQDHPEGDDDDQQEVEDEEHDARKDDRRVAKDAKKDAESLKKTLRREDENQDEEEGEHKTDKLLRRQFHKLDNRKRFSRIARESRRVARRHRRFHLRRRGHNRRAMRRDLSRMQRRMRREMSDKSGIRRELHRLNRNFHLLAKHLQRGERREDRTMDRRWNKFSRKGVDSKDFAHIKAQLRREKRSGRLDHFFDMMMNLMHKGFGKDRKKDRKDRHRIDKNLEHEQEQGVDSRDFRRLDKKTKKDARRDRRADRRSKRALRRALRRDARHAKRAHRHRRFRLGDSLLAGLRSKIAEMVSSIVASKIGHKASDKGFGARIRRHVDAALAEFFAKHHFGHSAAPAPVVGAPAAQGQVIYALRPRHRRHRRQHYAPEGFPEMPAAYPPPQYGVPPPSPFQLTHDDVHAIVYGAVRRALEEADAAGTK